MEHFLTALSRKHGVIIFFGQSIVCARSQFGPAAGFEQVIETLFDVAKGR